MKKAARGRKGSFFPYGLEFGVIAVVVTVAFFLPQIIFRVQDNLLWDDVTLGQRESMNVDSLSTSYEASLGGRMGKFAKGLAGNENYYITSQELTDESRLQDYLSSDKGLYQDIVTELVDYNLIPWEIWDRAYYHIAQWKQYVIYNDNYEEGVNFILWYIELQDEEGAFFKLLTDAEDGTIYGLKTEGGNLSAYPYDNNRYADNPLRYGMELWTYFAWYYEAVTEEDMDFLEVADKMGLDMSYFENETAEGEAEAFIREVSEVAGQDVEAVLERMFKYQLETDERICFFLPYEEGEVHAIWEIKERDSVKIDLYPNVTMGIRQIYEMIPEFA